MQNRLRYLILKAQSVRLKTYSRVRLLTAIFTAILLVNVLLFNSVPVLASNIPKVSAAPEATVNNNLPVIQKGVNYGSQWWEYNPSVTTDAILNRDFSQFQKDGIIYISLPLYWYRLEGPTKGDYTGSISADAPYGDPFLANVKHVIEIANQYGIKTMLDIHTLWGDDGTWCTPTYVLDPVDNTCDELAIVRSPAMMQAFINMFTNTVNYLKGTPGIYCYEINEPWYWPLSLPAPYNNINQEANFITLFQQMENISNTIGGCPFTIRMVTEGSSSVNIFTQDFSWDPAIYTSVNFMSFNAYVPDNYTAADLATWEAIVSQDVSLCISAGLQVWITEFGSDLPDNEGSTAYQTMLDFFQTLPVQGELAWMWRSDANEPNPDPPNSGYNICYSSTTGQGNYCYQTLITGIAPAVLKVSTNSLPNGTVGVAYSQILAATGGMTPYNWTIASGTLPVGLLLSSSGVISGTPTTAGSPTSVTFRVTDSTSATATASLSITISTPPTIATSSLPNGTVGVPDSQTLAATGGTSPYIWSIASGRLPAGLSLSSSGVISGTPTTAGGPTSVTFQVTDSMSATATKGLSITVVYAAWDVNMDGAVNVLDMILVTQDFGQTGTPGWIREDVNNDGVVNIQDSIIVGQHWTG